MALFQNLTASALIKSGAGKIYGFIVNSHTSGTVRFNDGGDATTSAGVKATGVLTGSGVFSDGEIVTIDETVYTMKTALSSPAVANEVLIGAGLTNSLDNLKQAINQGDTEGGGEGEGTNYGTGTVPHPTVTATTNTATAQTVQARDAGVAGNSIATTTDGANASWGAVVLESGVDENRLIQNTYTLPSGSQVVMYPEPIDFVNGLYYTEGGTADITVIYK